MAAAHGPLPRRNDGVRVNATKLAAFNRRGYGGSGGVSIDLSSSASAPYAQSQVLVPKICEMCTKSFLRPAIGNLRDCLECRTRQAKQREEFAKIPPMDGIEEEYGMKYENRRLAKAAHALSMRPVA